MCIRDRHHADRAAEEAERIRPKDSECAPSPVRERIVPLQHHICLLYTSFDDYVQVPSSYNGADLPMFDGTDLQFSGIDFMSMTPESARCV